MAQHSLERGDYLNNGDKLFEVMMLATLSGQTVSNSNPFPTANFQLQIARGLVQGITGLSISGYNSAVSTTWVPLWEIGTEYVYFGSAQQVRIWSDNAADTNVSILINGLDANYDMISETVLLTNNSTGVLSTQQFLRVNSLATVGSVNAVGTIHAGSSDKSIILAAIVDGAGRSQMTVYTVPRGYTFYLSQVNVVTNQNGNQYSNYRSFTKMPNGLTTKILQFPLTTDYNSSKVVPRPYVEKTDIQWQCSSSATSQIGGQIEGYLVANTAATGV
jgi:hypothetical protein